MCVFIVRRTVRCILNKESRLIRFSSKTHSKFSLSFVNCLFVFEITAIHYLQAMLLFMLLRFSPLLIRVYFFLFHRNSFVTRQFRQFVVITLQISKTSTSIHLYNNLSIWQTSARSNDLHFSFTRWFTRCLHYKYLDKTVSMLTMCALLHEQTISVCSYYANHINRNNSKLLSKVFANFKKIHFNVKTKLKLTF